MPTTGFTRGYGLPSIELNRRIENPEFEVKIKINNFQAKIV